MYYSRKIYGKKVYLRNIEISDCNENYLNWLNDPQINQFLETRHSHQSIELIKEFVTSQINSENSYLFAIIEKKTGRHIGNIKLGPINYFHLFAEVSYFIGEKIYWGKGFATEAIGLVTKFGFDKEGLFKCIAGIYESNEASKRALEKAGYRFEGSIKKKLINCSKQREDHLYFGIVNEAP